MKLRNTNICNTLEWNSLQVSFHCGHFGRWNFISSDKMLFKHYEIIRKETFGHGNINETYYSIAVVTFELQSKVLCAKETKYVRMYQSMFSIEDSNIKFYIFR